MKHGFNSEVRPEFRLTCHILSNLIWELPIVNLAQQEAWSMMGLILGTIYIWSSLVIGRKIVNDKCHAYSFKILLFFWLAQIRWLIFWQDLLIHGYRNFSQTSPEYFLQNIYWKRCIRYSCRLSWVNLTTPRARGQKKLRLSLHVG